MSAADASRKAAAGLQDAAGSASRWDPAGGMHPADLAELAGLLRDSCEALAMVLVRYGLEVRTYWLGHGSGNYPDDAEDLYRGTELASGHVLQAQCLLAQARKGQRALLARQAAGSFRSEPTRARLPQLVSARQLKHGLKLAEDARFEPGQESLANVAESLADVLASLNVSLGRFAEQAAAFDVPAGFRPCLGEASMHCQEAGPHLTTVKAFLRTNRLRATA
jgi:hypothetical protein